MPPDLRGRVFEPGFSTKGKGRGKGLHVVRQMALEAGGHVEIGASENRGASFRMVLPASLVRTPQSSSGLWNAGVTWPQMRVPIAEVGEEDAEGRAVGAARRTGSSG
ncbi:MAG: ATP-binding protein [Polyangiaceae bacterium]